MPFLQTLGFVNSDTGGSEISATDITCNCFLLRQILKSSNLNVSLFFLLLLFEDFYFFILIVIENYLTRDTIQYCVR